MLCTGIKYCTWSKILLGTSSSSRIRITGSAYSSVCCSVFYRRPFSFSFDSPSVFCGNISRTSIQTASLLSTCRYFTTTPESLVVGNTANGIRTPDETVCEISDIIGPGGVTGGGTLSIGVNKRLSAGDVLGIMDLCAARTAMIHLTGVKIFPTIKTPRKQRGDSSVTEELNDVEPSLEDLFPYSVATVATDGTNFLHPLLEGDPVIVRGTVVSVGSSSIGVHVEVMRIQFPTREKLTVAYSFFTMVVIDRNLSKAKVAPALNISHPRHLYLHNVYHKEMATTKLLRVKHDELDKKFSEASKIIKDRSVEGGESLFKKQQTELLRLFDEIETPINKAKQFKTAFASSRVEASRVFFPGHLNFNHTVFGGEILRWMEMHAVHCGRLFTGRPHVSSVRMHNVTFNKAIYLNDWVTLEAHVVYVHNTTMEVDVKLSIEHIVGAASNGEVQGNGLRKLVTATEQTNTASFVLILFDEIGKNRKIDTGLELCSSDEIPTEDSIKSSIRWLRRYSEAKLRYKIRHDERLTEGFIADMEKYQLSAE